MDDPSSDPPLTEQTQPNSNFVAPRTPTEVGLAGIWAQVLGLERVDIHADFLELGGDSILAIQILSLVREEFGVETAMMPTVAIQAENIERARSQADEIRRALSEIENLSDAEAQQLLAQESKRFT